MKIRPYRDYKIIPNQLEILTYVRDACLRQNFSFYLYLSSKCRCRGNCRILRLRRSDREPLVRIRQRLKIGPLRQVLQQRRLRWFGHAARRPEGELIKDVLMASPLPSWRKRIGGQLLTWSATLKKDLTWISGPQVVGVRRWNRSWREIACQHAQDRRAWAAMVRDVVIAREEAGSIRPG